MSDRHFEKYEKRGAYHWEQISNSVSRHNAFVAERYATVVRAACPLEGRHVLDLGCGDGALSFLLQKYTGRRLVSLDVDRVGLRLAQQEFSKRRVSVDLTCATGYNLPFATGAFDSVICSDVIEHIRFPEKVLREIARVLADGGKMILTTPCRVSEYPADPLHIKEFFPGELQALLQNYFSSVSVNLSHPVAITDLYGLHFRFIGRPLFRYLVNLLSILGYNLFQASGFHTYGLIIATGEKRPSWC